MSLACYSDIYKICCEEQEEAYPTGSCSSMKSKNELPILSPQRIKRKVGISA